MFARVKMSEDFEVERIVGWKYNEEEVNMTVCMHSFKLNDKGYGIF